MKRGQRGLVSAQEGADERAPEAIEVASVGVSGESPSPRSAPSAPSDAAVDALDMDGVTICPMPVKGTKSDPPKTPLAESPPRGGSTEQDLTQEDLDGVTICPMPPKGSK